MALAMESETPCGDRICAVIATYDRPALLARCLEAVRAQTRALDGVVVVDSAGSAETAALLGRPFPRGALLSLPENLGPAGAFARGMAAALEAGYAWIWLMDDDVAPDPGCLAELAAVAARARRRVVVPRRLTPAGVDCANEAVLHEAEQRFERVVTEPAREQYRPIDLFTFEGPLLHRSVVEAVGLPERGLFIRGEDVMYAIRINRRFGPLSGAVATRAVVKRQLPHPEGVTGRFRLKGWICESPEYQVLGDEEHWKVVYELRNRHLIWRALGWRRRRRRLILAHLGYVAVDLAHAWRRGWHWRLRLRANLASLALGCLGRSAPFLDPGAYRVCLAARSRSGARP